MIKELPTGHRIEFYLYEERETPQGDIVEQRKFYISPVYKTEQDLNNRIEELLNMENFIDGVVISCKILEKG